MAKHTPSIAKNQMRRCLRAIIDPHPTTAEIAELWEYFQRSCAYCGGVLSHSDRTGQLDHVVAHSKGGTNSIFNHVLSCGPCNGDEKREQHWENFLAQQESNVEVQKMRHSRIKFWLDRHVDKSLFPADVQQEIDALEKAATDNFDIYVQSMRELRQRYSPNS
jgi:HNH endonuclease